ncbi:MAG TPA: hypothetical protein VIY73_21955 [Polyangiaceae bacterium]
MTTPAPSAGGAILGQVLAGTLAALHTLAANRGDVPVVRQVEALQDLLRGVEPPAPASPPAAPTAALHCTHPDGSTSDGAGGPAPKPDTSGGPHPSTSAASYEAIDAGLRAREAARVAGESTTATERKST